MRANKEKRKRGIKDEAREEARERRKQGREAANVRGREGKRTPLVRS